MPPPVMSTYAQLRQLSVSEIAGRSSPAPGQTLSVLGCEGGEPNADLDQLLLQLSQSSTQH